MRRLQVGLVIDRTRQGEENNTKKKLKNRVCLVATLVFVQNILCVCFFLFFGRYLAYGSWSNAVPIALDWPKWVGSKQKSSQSDYSRS